MRRTSQRTKVNKNKNKHKNKGNKTIEPFENIEEEKAGPSAPKVDDRAGFSRPPTGKPKPKGGEDNNNSDHKPKGADKTTSKYTKQRSKDENKDK